jgi:hypothetical protein
MADDTTELRERLSIIESMIAEGQRSTESWGSTFVLWGVAYYVAIAWSRWGHGGWAWPVTISVAALLTVVLTFSRLGGHPRTTLGRAIGSIWIALGISMFLLFFAAGLTGRLTDRHLFFAVISAILGLANGASALILRWKVQLACAAVWWAAAIATCFGSDTQSIIVFLVAIFLCQIVFGIYGMIASTQGRKRQAPLHA